MLSILQHRLAPCLVRGRNNTAVVVRGGKMAVMAWQRGGGVHFCYVWKRELILFGLGRRVDGNFLL